MKKLIGASTSGVVLLALSGSAAWAAPTYTDPPGNTLYTTSATPTLSVPVSDGAGLNAASAEFRYSVDGGTTYSQWLGRAAAYHESRTCTSAGTCNCGTCYIYWVIVNNPNYVIQSGDHFYYDIYDASNSSGSSGSLDFETNSAGPLRDSGIKDQNGFSGHPGTDISSMAYRKWYSRDFALDGSTGFTSLVGKTIICLVSARDGNHTTTCSDGSTRFWFRNVRIATSNVTTGTVRYEAYQDGCANFAQPGSGCGPGANNASMRDAGNNGTYDPDPNTTVSYTSPNISATINNSLSGDGCVSGSNSKVNSACSFPVNPLSNLSAGSNNRIQYRIRNNSNVFADSTQYTVCVDNSAPDTPATPSGSSACGSTTVTFNWSATADNGCAGVASYNVQIGTTAGGNDVFNGNVAALTKAITGTNGTTYFCRIQAVDNAGNTGPFSGNSAGVTVNPNPSVPTGLSASPSPICAGASSTLSGTAGAGGTIVQWFSGGSCGGTPLNTSGTSVLVSPSTTTTYSAWTLSAAGCHSSCSGTTVTVTVIANGGTCNDGNACTQTDTCQSGTCVGSNPVTCTASDQCHNAGTCNPANGTCSNPAKADGNPCNDGNACTQTDTCQAGSCTGSNPVTCTASDQCHNAGTCNPANGTCSDPAKADGNACNDGNACTQTDTCQSGSCTGSNPVTCTASDQCHNAGTCNPANGTCSNPAKPDGTACSDGDACTQTDTCQVGSCTGSNPVICTASDQCHDAGTCNPANGTCSNPASSDGTFCDDGNACTQSDACAAGVCEGTNTCAPPTLSSWKSVRMHDAAGQRGGPLEMSIECINGGTSEPRRGGIQKLLVTFSETVVCGTHGGSPNSGDISASASPSMSVPSPASIGFVGGGSSGTQLVVTYNPGDLPDLHSYTFDLAGKFKSQSTGLGLGGTPSVTVRGMEGDVTFNGMVTNVGDVAQTKDSNGLKLANSSLNDANCQYDANTDGAVNLIDVAFVKSKLTP